MVPIPGADATEHQSLRHSHNTSLILHHGRQVSWCCFDEAGSVPWGGDAPIQNAGHHLDATDA